MNPTEKDIQRTIVDYLESHGCLVFEFAKPGGHKQLAGSVIPGLPDILALRRGRSLWVEVKRPGGKLSQHQAVLHQELLAAGAYVIVARSVEDVRDNLHLLGLEVEDRLI